MPAKSKKQQRFFGLVHAYLNGKVKNPSPDVRRAAESMSSEDVDHFAKTKHEGLPEKVAETQEELAARWEAQRAADLHMPMPVKQVSGAPYASFLDRVVAMFTREPTQAELEERFYQQHPELKHERQNGPVQQTGSTASPGVQQSQQKAGQFVVDVDPGNRLNRERRARKVLEKLLEPGDDEKEFEKAKRDLAEKNQQDRRNLENGAEKLKKALTVLADFLPEA